MGEEEKKIIQVLQKRDQADDETKDVQFKLDQIMTSVSKTKNNEVFNLIKNHQRLYSNNLRQTAVFSRNSVIANLIDMEATKEVSEDPPLAKKNTLSHYSKQLKELANKTQPKGKKISWQSTQSVKPECPIEKRIALVDNLLQNFKYRSGENDYDFIESMLSQKDSVRLELENQIEQLICDVGSLV